MKPGDRVRIKGPAKMEATIVAFAPSRKVWVTWAEGIEALLSIDDIEPL